MSAQPQPKQDQPSRSQRASSTETRLTIVETRWEDVIPTLATKRDISDLRAEIKSDIARAETKAADNTVSLIKWIVGTGIATVVLLVTVLTFVLNNAVPRYLPAVQQPAPIIQERSDWQQPVPAPALGQPATANEQ